MNQTPTDAELMALVETHLGLKTHRDDTVFDPRTGRFHEAQRYRDFARAVLAKCGTPAPVGVGEVAERYRNAIASACEGWTMPDGLRKHLETALWSPPTPQPTQTQPVAREQLADEQIQDLLLCGDPTDEEMRLIRIGWDAARGIKGGQHG